MENCCCWVTGWYQAITAPQLYSYDAIKINYRLVTTTTTRDWTVVFVMPGPLSNITCRDYFKFEKHFTSPHHTTLLLLLLYIQTIEWYLLVQQLDIWPYGGGIVRTGDKEQLEESMWSNSCGGHSAGYPDITHSNNKININIWLIMISISIRRNLVLKQYDVFHSIFATKLQSMVSILVW